RCYSRFLLSDFGYSCCYRYLCFIVKLLILIVTVFFFRSLFRRSSSFVLYSLTCAATSSKRNGKMGAFLEKPKVEKYEEDGSGNGLRYAAASMQGWRTEMEDAHTAV